jgi:STE24 endopeptidase
LANEDKSARYQRLRRRAAVAATLVDLLLPIALAVSGLATAIGNVVSGPGAPGPLAVVCLVLLVCAVRTAIVVAIGVQTELASERRYRGHERSTASWIFERIFGAAGTAAAVVLAAIVVQRAGLLSPVWWWLWVSLLAAVVVLAAVQWLPRLLSPGAADVHPIAKRPDLDERLRLLAARVGTARVEVLEWRRRSGAADAVAMLVGLGSSNRVLVAQAVLDSHTDEEVEVIVAHELAHHRHRDVWWSGAAVVTTLTLGFYAAARLLEALPVWWGVGGAADLAGLLIVATVCRGVFVAMTPVVNALSRAQERRADRDALAWTNNAPALVRTLRRLSAAHMADDRPSLMTEAFFGRHPSVRDRIQAAEAWAARANVPAAHPTQSGAAR